MRIATWNINSVRIRLNQLADFTNTYKPDIIMLQETKVADYAFPSIECMSMGFEHIKLSGEKSYNGVAILSKYPLHSDFRLEFYNHDKRHVAASFRDIEIHNFYVPAGGDEPDVEINHKFKHKMAYLDMMHEWFASKRSSKQKIILVGDLNIAPLEHDVWSSKQLKNTISHTDIERSKLMRNLTDFGFIDAPRMFVNNNEKLYSWWSYRTPNWQASNRGRRLDHIWVSNALKDNVQGTLTAKEMRSDIQPSDHVPVILDIM